MAKKKDRSYRAYRKRKKRNKIIIILSVLLVILAPFGIGAAYAYHVVDKEAVDIDTSRIYEDINQKTVLYDDKGKEIESLFFSDGNRKLIKYEDLPQNMIDAIVSIEDKTFFEHHGFNIVRMLGAIKERLVSGGQISGTSTITQQLSRNLYLSEIKSDRTLNRKILEAYYAIILERELSKEQILEAYLNTVYFGYSSYGVETASQNYYKKSVSELDLIECVALAALPQAPDINALVKADYSGGKSDMPVLKKKNGVNYLYGGASTADRRSLILSLMKENGMITDSEYAEAMEEDLQEHMHITVSNSDSAYTYMLDYTIEQVAADLADELGITKQDANAMIYGKGLKIYTTMNTHVQEILDKQINDNDNYTSIANIPTDSDGNIINRKSGDILLRPYSYYFSDKGTFILKKKEYKYDDDGNLVLKHGKRLVFYEVESDGTKYVQPEFKSMYQNDDGLYFIEGGGLSIPAGYTTFDDNKNCVVSKAFLQEFPDFFKKSGKKLKVSKSNYVLKQKMRQPQAAAVVMENSTGEIKAMTGGRGAKGKYLYNRATNPRQPGSSIKPIAVYGPGLQASVDSLKKNDRGDGMKLNSSDGSRWGKYITAGSVINDAPMTVNGKQWPKNAGGGYMGRITLRKALQQSVNVCAVKILQQIGVDYSIKKLKKNGITTIDEKGETNDLNPAALALGGMTNGISPLEMTAAYATFPNKGVHKDPIFYTSVENASGTLILEKEVKTKRVFDEGVAYIMTDMLESAVAYGTGREADFNGQSVAGKTGTTSDQYDIWFAGFTPKYTMALWEGNDINIEMTSMSSAAASFWSHIMRRLCEDEPRGSFPSMPDDVSKIKGEYYIEGTYSGSNVVESTTKATTKSTTKSTTKAKKKKDDDDDYYDDDDDTEYDPEIEEWLKDFYY